MPPLPQPLPQAGPYQGQPHPSAASAVPASGAISFETLAEIAAGATARVDLCRLTPPHPRAGSLVAVKRLHPHVAEDPTFVKQFLDEVRFTYWLRHPNVVEVAGWGTDQQGSYLAVELVSGVSLLRLMKTIFDTGEAFTERMVVYLAAGICRGLGAAHSLRAPDGEMLHLVHRDLTPSNVLVGFNGEIKITDFGMAKAKQRLTKTLTGMRKGEPTYMAPEQARSDEIDARADIFSLGVMLFELFAGRRPWIAKSDYEMVQITTRDPPADLRELRPKIDKELVNVVNRCLERNPADRFQTAAEIGARLDEWLTVHGYQEGNEEALGRFVRRNAMRQMRWFERAVAGEMSPERVGRELPPRVPTYTEHTHRPGSEPPPDDPAVPMPSALSAAGARPLVPPRPAGAPADPRSIRAANAVQQLKKLAPAIEPPRNARRGRNVPEIPRLHDADDDGDATDVEMRYNPASLVQTTPGGRVPAGEARLRGAPVITGAFADDEPDDEGGEEIPTLVQTGDSAMQRLRADARARQARGGGGAAAAAAAAAARGPAPAVGAKPSYPIADEASDQSVTEVKREQRRSSAATIAAVRQPEGGIADPESDFPTAPIASGRPKPPPDFSDEMPTPIAPQKAKSTQVSLASPPGVMRRSRDHGPDPGMRQVIPPSPDIPPRPFPMGPSARTNKSAPDAPPPARTTARPPPPSPMPLPQGGLGMTLGMPQATPQGAPAAPAAVPPAMHTPLPDPSRTSQHDDVQQFDRAAFQAQRAPTSEDAIVAEADRLAIEAVRRSEEARAAQQRADRKAAAAKLAGEAAMIAAEAVRMIRPSGLAAAGRRLEEARALEQNLQTGKIPMGEISAQMRAQTASFPGSGPAPSAGGARPGYTEPPSTPSISSAQLAHLGSQAAGPSHPPSAYPPASHAAHGAGSVATSSSSSVPIFAGAAAGPPPVAGPASLPPPPQPYAPSMHDLRASTPQVSVPDLPGSRDRGPLVDPDAFRSQLKPAFLGLPGPALAGLAVVALLLVVLLILVLAK